MKIKKYIIVPLLSIVLLTGCSNETFDKAMEEGKIALASKEYDKAQNLFSLAVEENKKDEEANKLYSQIQKLVEAEKLKEEGKIEKSVNLCNEISKIDSESDVVKKQAIELRKELKELVENIKQLETEIKEDIAKSEQIMSNNKYEDTIYTESENYKEYINNPHIVLSRQEILGLYQSTQKDTLEYEIIDPNEYYVESTFNTFEHYEGMIDRQIVSEKKYGQILYPYIYDSYKNNISLQKETVMYLISLVLPSDVIEERVLTNKGYGQECRVYSSSKGTFVVRMQKAQYFNGTQPYYNEDEIVDLKYLKLIE